MADKKRRTIEEIMHDVETAVYKAVAPLYEEAEHADLIIGNGHHMAQNLCNEAKELLLKRAADRRKFGEKGQKGA